MRILLLLTSHHMFQEISRIHSHGNCDGYLSLSKQLCDVRKISNHECAVKVQTYHLHITYVKINSTQMV